MDSHLTEEALWASGLASRLKLLQANFADDATTTQWVREAIAATAATGAGQVGQVVGHVMKAHKGEVDVKRVKEIAGRVLGGV